MKINQMEPVFGRQEKKAIMKYMDSDGWLTEHKKTRQLEQMIADYTGAKHCSVICNGTMTLVSALLAHNIGAGDEVIVPDYTMIATANAVHMVGAKPVFVDICINRLGLSFKDMKEAITDKTKAIMFVSINGRFPKDGYDIIEYCKDRDIIVIEDAAQSLGCFKDAKHLGTFGDIGSFSLSMPKIITCGQGGAIVTDNKDIYQRIKMIKNFGRPEDGVDKYEIIGYNFKFTDLQAVIGIEQMKKLPQRVRRKKQMFLHYMQRLEDISKVKFVDTDLRWTAPWMMDMIVKNRDKLIKDLEKDGIGARPFYPAIHTQLPYNWVKGFFPNSYHTSNHGVWLPSSIKLSDRKIDYICKKVKDALK